MERGTRVFWSVIAVIVAAAIFFGVSAERKRMTAAKSGGGLATGDLATLVSVNDGDTVVLANDAGDKVVVRILGIKAFEDTTGRDTAATYGNLAVAELKRELEHHAIRVLVANPAKDKTGRTLATLFVDDHDVGLKLVRDGLVLVYTAFPFPGMQRYLEEQDRAHVERKGLWSDPAATLRAERLLGAWRKEAP